MLALASIGICLTTRHEPTRLLLSGGVGLIGLGFVLFRESSSRVLFAGASLSTLAIYVWAGNESVRMDILLDRNRLWATVGEVTISAEVPSDSRGRVGLAISQSRPPPARLSEPLQQLVQIGAQALSTNVASGVRDLELSALDGRPLAGPLTFWEPYLRGAPPIVADADGLDSVGEHRVLGESDWNSLTATLDVRNGGPPLTLLLRLDEHMNGVAVRAWPDRRELSIHEMRNGTLERELAGGYQTFRKPPLAGFQSLLRELLRAWLMGMGLLALGVLMAPVARSIPGPADWWTPMGLGPVAALILALAGLSAAAWIASELLERIPHVQDSVAYLFQAKTFALGRLTAPLPAVPEAFDHEFIVAREGAWFSMYPPGHPVLLTLGVLAGQPWLVSPALAAFTLLLLYVLGRSLFDGATGLLASMLLLFSPFFLFMSGSMMSHPTGLFLSTLGLVLVSRCVRSESGWVPILAGVTLGWLTTTRQLTGLATTAPVICWLAWRRFQEGRSLNPILLFAVGWSWPVLGLLAYNRALTGDPFLQTHQLWWDSNRAGFGPTLGIHGGHDLGRGLWNTYANITELQTHLFGWPVYLTLAFAALPFSTGRARAGDWLCGAVSVCLILAYISYWADGIMYGPRYFYEAIGCLALLTARGVMSAAEATSGRPRGLLRLRSSPSSASFFVLLVFTLIWGNLVGYLPDQIDLYRGYNDVDGERQAVVRAADIHQALVLVPTSDPLAWWEYGSVFSANDPLLRGDVIYGRDLGPTRNQRTLQAYPDRTAYLLADGKLTRLR